MLSMTAEVTRKSLLVMCLAKSFGVMVSSCALPSLSLYCHVNAFVGLGGGPSNSVMIFWISRIMVILMALSRAGGVG